MSRSSARVACTSAREGCTNGVRGSRAGNRSSGGTLRQLTADRQSRVTCVAAASWQVKRGGAACARFTRSGPSGASQGGNDTCGRKTYQRDRFSPSIPALRCGLTPEDPEPGYADLARPERGLSNSVLAGIFTVGVLSVLADGGKSTDLAGTKASVHGSHGSPIPTRRSLSVNGPELGCLGPSLVRRGGARTLCEPVSGGWLLRPSGRPRRGTFLPAVTNGS